MANLSKSVIEDRAEQLLTDQLGGSTVPVDLEKLVRRMGGSIQVRFDGYRDPESLYVAEDGTFTVFVPPNTSMLRDRFTIAHELGHLMLHHDMESTEPVSFQRYGRSREETEANAFAGALLMPADKFRTAWARHGRNLAKVARQFQVSQSAADVRRQVLGLPL